MFPDFLLLHSSPLKWKGHPFWVLVLKGLVDLHRTVQLQLLQRYWLGHRLGLPWYWMVCLGNKQRSFRHFWDCIQVLHFRLFCWLWWLVQFFQGILACRNGGCLVQERSSPMSKVRSSSFALLEQPWRILHVQGKRNPSKMVGTERGHQRADRLKPQSQTTSQSDHMDHSLV